MMTDNMKGLLDKLETIARRLSVEGNSTLAAMLIGIHESLRTAVEEMESNRELLFEAGQVEQERAESAERGRDELKRRIPSLKTQLDDLAHECEELKRRLEVGHAENCDCHPRVAYVIRREACELCPGGEHEHPYIDPRYLALRKGK